MQVTSPDALSIEGAFAFCVQSDGFTGEQTDANGQVYLRARYYDPSLGVFPSLDPFEGMMDRPMSMNGYSWVEGNTPNMADPSGMTTDVIDQGGGGAGGGHPSAWARALEQIFGNSGVSRGVNRIASHQLSRWLRNNFFQEGIGFYTDTIRIGSHNYTAQQLIAAQNQLGARVDIDQLRAFTQTYQSAQYGINIFGDVLGLTNNPALSVVAGVCAAGLDVLLQSQSIALPLDSNILSVEQDDTDDDTIPIPYDMPLDRTRDDDDNLILVSHYTSNQRADEIIDQEIIRTELEGRGEAYVYVFEGRSNAQRASDAGAVYVEARIVFDARRTELELDPEQRDRLSEPGSTLILEARRFIRPGPKSLIDRNPCKETPRRFGFGWTRCR